ncbi:phosphotyrosine protein phosphatase [Dactylosporangium aurantiacum]|uniref:protein-tyrosine-phosphatase n=1 Tax=Dactylosporangium aurantiacum TaxID=35754 RepID=A0A9Q9MNM9_9ACTN|nr:phosphotyrosine protein phosphatase [Dactylosporangium aurantiacum]MDG6106084.1 phosphotyrosine protein phosphatase [Dactylosporangium aurantiacum]UWZ55872.1 phosphotyrosine protein phosphatase [Dactylosporangium aurantiacum]
MAPFSILCVCMGNICRSPMAERLLVADLVALGAEPDLVYVHGAGTGGWHAGEPMDPQAARQVLARGGDTAGFRARKLLGEHVDASDLVLTATAEQVDFVVSLRPDAAARTFVWGQFARLLRTVTAGLPPAGRDADSVYARGVALVDLVDKARADAGDEARDEDDLADPWGRPDDVFGVVADQIQALTRPLGAALLGVDRSGR